MKILMQLLLVQLGASSRQQKKHAFERYNEIKFLKAFDSEQVKKSTSQGESPFNIGLSYLLQGCPDLNAKSVNKPKRKESKHDKSRKESKHDVSNYEKPRKKIKYEINFDDLKKNVDVTKMQKNDIVFFLEFENDFEVGYYQYMKTEEDNNKTHYVWQDDKFKLTRSRTKYAGVLVDKLLQTENFINMDEENATVNHEIFLWILENTPKNSDQFMKIQNRNPLRQLMRLFTENKALMHKLVNILINKFHCNPLEKNGKGISAMQLAVFNDDLATVKTFQEFVQVNASNNQIDMLQKDLHESLDKFMTINKLPMNQETYEYLSEVRKPGFCKDMDKDGLYDYLNRCNPKFRDTAKCLYNDKINTDMFLENFSEIAHDYKINKKDARLIHQQISQDLKIDTLPKVKAFITRNATKKEAKALLEAIQTPENLQTLEMRDLLGICPDWFYTLENKLMISFQAKSFMKSLMTALPGHVAQEICSYNINGHEWTAEILPEEKTTSTKIYNLEATNQVNASNNSSSSSKKLASSNASNSSTSADVSLNFGPFGIGGKSNRSGSNQNAEESQIQSSNQKSFGVALGGSHGNSRNSANYEENQRSSASYDHEEQGIKSVRDCQNFCEVKRSIIQQHCIHCGIPRKLDTATCKIEYYNV